MGIGETGAGQVDTSTTQPNAFSYVALGLTLVLACIELFAAVRGHAMPWSSSALLIALACAAITGFMQTPALKHALSITGLVFVIVAVYGIATR